ncbi:MAG: ABC transporter ATP-binding protein [Synergistaceae bacterium]|nr:ABC transporter ATP-binding protein [Synergistaceae bacterium]
MAYAVEMSNICKSFNKGKVQALDGVNFTLGRAKIHGILGENGAGKTTLMNVLFGLYRADSGTICVNGKPVEIHRPKDARALGIGMVHQHFMLVRTMTVAENVVLGLPSSKAPFLDIKSATSKLLELSNVFGLKIDPGAKVWQLSVGEQQRAEIVSVLYRGVDILILDEPTAVLTPAETRDFFKMLGKMKAEGKSVVLITHKLEEIFDIADEATVLRNGKLACSTEVSNTSKQELTRMMVGKDVLFNLKKSSYEKNALDSNERLKVKNLSALNNKGLSALDNLNFSIEAGEILGVAGVDGNGQSELCEVLTGLRRIESGDISVNGTSCTGREPKAFIDLGVAHIPEDRHMTGMAMNMDVSRNLIIKDFDRKEYSFLGILKSGAIERNADRAIAEYEIKTSGAEARVRELSGGNQQKIILARELGKNPKVIIANQPTRGLDIGATEYVRQKLLEARDNGAAILLVSADLEEIMQLSDRIAVMYRGRMTGIVPGASTMEEIGLMMAGYDNTKPEACNA